MGAAAVLPLVAQAQFFGTGGREDMKRTLNKALPDFDKWQLSEAEWQTRLAAEPFRVLRKHGTERAGTSPLNAEKRAGVFACGGCGLEMYSSAHKYESGTGWPSFYDVIDPARVGQTTDRKIPFMTRTEVYCARCGGHHGHVFTDGPQPTGLRYCLNGVALRFIPA